MKVDKLNYQVGWVGLIIVVLAVIVAVVAVVVPSRPAVAQCVDGLEPNPAYTELKRNVDVLRTFHRVQPNGYARDMMRDNPEHLRWIIAGGDTIRRDKPSRQTAGYLSAKLPPRRKHYTGE